MSSSETPDTATTKTAIVTGACSGIGLALTRHLLRQHPSTSHPYQWRVVLADINPDSFTSISPLLEPHRDRTLFVRTDVSSWDDNVALFDKASAWPMSTASSQERGTAGGRIDFLAANAGIDDRERVQAHFDLDSTPQKPNLACLDVNLLSVFYQLKLLIHHTRRTRRDLLSSHPPSSSSSSQPSTSSSQQQQQKKLDFNPVMTITSSCVGQYPFPPAPHYAAAKHALLGLVRSTAAALHADDGIRINAVMPAFVPTNLAPPGLVDAWPKEHVTPASTVVAAYEELLDGAGGVGGEVWDFVEGAMVRVRSDGVRGVRKAGCTVECSLDCLFYREPVGYPNESQRWMVEQTAGGGMWVGKAGYGGKKEREDGVASAAQ